MATDKQRSECSSSSLFSAIVGSRSFQNLIDFLLVLCSTSPQNIMTKFVHNFLSNPVYRQTDKQTKAWIPLVQFVVDLLYNKL